TKDKRQISAAIAALQAFQQDFPASDEAQRAGLLLTRLRQSHASPEEAIRDLAAIRPGEPTYVSAQYEICQLQYQLWSKAKSDAAKADRQTAELVKVVERFLALSGGTNDGERRIKVALLAVDALQSAAAADSTRIKSLLTNVAPL